MLQRDSMHLEAVSAPVSEKNIIFFRKVGKSYRINMVLCSSLLCLPDMKDHSDCITTVQRTTAVEKSKKRNCPTPIDIRETVMHDSNLNDRDTVIRTSGSRMAISIKRSVNTQP